MRQPGIHARILVSAIFLISVATFALAVKGISISQDFINQKYKEHLSLLVTYLAKNVEVAILVNDKTWLNRLSANLLSEERDITRIVISKESGDVLVDIGKKSDGSLSCIKVMVVPQKPVDINMLFSEEGLNVLSGKLREKPIGSVAIFYSSSAVWQLIEVIKRQFLGFALVIVCLAGIIFYFISRSIVSEIRKLAKAARQVAEGDFGLRLLPGALPEARLLAEGFNTMLDSIAAQNHALVKAEHELMRRDFLAEMGKFSLMVAHEVKNPLAIIKSSLDILKKDYAQETNQLMIEYIDDEVRRLNTLIENFLIFARPAKPVFAAIDANSLLADLIARLPLMNQVKGVVAQKIPDAVCLVKADSDLLTRVLTNLVSNAVDASEGSVDQILIEAGEDADEWMVSVSDRGMGIHDDDLGKIFEPFFTTKAKGCGLGLAFAYQVVRSHGGRLSAENREGGGAIFRIFLPKLKKDGEH